MTTDGEDFLRGQNTNTQTLGEVMFNFQNRPKSNQGLRQQASMDANPAEAGKFKSALQHAAMQPLTRKEIARDIFLEKELDTSKQTEYQYIFRVVSKSLKIITFIADFQGSDKVEFSEGTVKKIKDNHGNEVQDGRMVYQETIQPEFHDNEVQEKSTLIVVVKLKDGWKLKTKFRFTLSNPSKELQTKFVYKDNELLKKQF